MMLENRERVSTGDENTRDKMLYWDRSVVSFIHPNKTPGRMSQVSAEQ
jgi:hypothetical protein